MGEVQGVGALHPTVVTLSNLPSRGTTTKGIRDLLSGYGNVSRVQLNAYEPGGATVYMEDVRACLSVLAHSKLLLNGSFIKVKPTRLCTSLRANQSVKRLINTGTGLLHPLNPSPEDNIISCSGLSGTMITRKTTPEGDLPFYAGYEHYLDELSVLSGESVPSHQEHLDSDDYDYQSWSTEPKPEEESFEFAEYPYMASRARQHTQEPQSVEEEVYQDEESFGEEKDSSTLRIT